ncbi:MAG: beta-galactosidase [Anaerolineaceae bacterium]|nr:beta-galactosidase [Anaerolineaceae bacterium]
MKLNKMIYGGDYNPEQWSEEIWQEDVRLMQEAGVNLVSLGIFSWAKLEPQDGVFEFLWLDRLMDLLHANGIAVDLSTPTASPPAWMITKHEDILPITAEGYPLWHGSRRHYCPHNPQYRRYAARIAEKLAERYKDHPALAMWHIDNEYGCHVGECFCDTSVQAFRDWLMERYQSVDAFNHAWGTAFWGQQYGNWQEIQPPRITPAHSNPTQQLDWKRFTSDSWIDCFKEQRDVIRSITPQIEITTNFMGFHKGIDYFKFAGEEDHVSNDNYPDTYQSDWMVQAGMVCDLIRSIGNGKPWMLMEQSTSQVNWRPRNVVKRPGVMRLGSMQALARGADGVMFFQWRQSKAGAEKHHSGMLPHSGTDTRVWREVKGLGNELAGLSEIVGSTVDAEAAILMDWENWWALEIDSKPSNELKLLPQLYKMYRYFHERNIPVNFAHPESDLSEYKFVAMPNLYLVGDQAAENINQYVQQGGTLLMTYFSGVVDANEHIRLGGYPASFREMLGMWVEEYVPYPDGLKNKIACNDGKYFECDFWADVIRLESAKVLASFEEDYFADMPAITQNSFGKGQAYYLGTELNHDGNVWLLDQICSSIGINATMCDAGEGIEAIRRTKNEESWLFLMNYTNKAVAVNLAHAGINVLHQVPVSGTVTVSANDVLIIKQTS